MKLFTIIFLKIIQDSAVDKKKITWGSTGKVSMMGQMLHKSIKYYNLM